jgi:hypothetical protein
MSSSESDSDWEYINSIRARKPRKFRARIDYLTEFDDEEFHKRFRLTKESFRELLEVIRPKISSKTRR